MSIELLLHLQLIAVGVFFNISGMHKLFDYERHQALVNTLKEDEVPFVSFNQWWVPFWEAIGGLLLVINHPVTTFIGGTAVIVILLTACVVDGCKRVEAYQPIDFLDRICDWLYLPEVLYIFLLLPSYWLSLAWVWDKVIT